MLVGFVAVWVVDLPDSLIEDVMLGRPWLFLIRGELESLYLLYLLLLSVPDCGVKDSFVVQIWRPAVSEERTFLESNELGMLKRFWVRNLTR